MKCRKVVKPAPCEQSLPKTHQRASKRCSAEIALSRCSPSFWASHFGQTGLGSAHTVFLARPKSNLQYENQHGVRSGIEIYPGFETGSKNGLRILNKELTRFLQSSFFVVE